MRYPHWRYDASIDVRRLFESEKRRLYQNGKSRWPHGTEAEAAWECFGMRGLNVARRFAARVSSPLAFTMLLRLSCMRNNDQFQHQALGSQGWRLLKRVVPKPSLPQRYVEARSW